MVQQGYIYTSSTGVTYWGTTKEDLVHKVFEFTINKGRLYYRKIYYKSLIDKGTREYPTSMSSGYSGKEQLKLAVEWLFEILEKE